MNNKSKSNRYYIKYLIKSTKLFLIFLFVSTLLFYFLSVSIKLDIMKTYVGHIENGAVAIETDHMLESSLLYIYHEKEKIVYKIKPEEFLYQDGYQYFLCEKKDIENLENLQELYVDVPVGKETLLERVLLKAGNAYEK